MEDKVLQEFNISIASFGPKKRKPELNLFVFSRNLNPLDGGRLIESVKLKKNNQYFEIDVDFDENGRTSFDSKKRQSYETEAQEIESIIENQKLDEKASVHKLLNKIRKKSRKDVNCLNSVMSKQTLCSNRIADSTIPYAVGHLNVDQDDLRLFPIQAAFEFRTDFGYIDREISAHNVQEYLEDKDHSERVQIDSSTIEDATSTDATKRIILRYESADINDGKPKRCYFDQLQKRLQQEPWTELTLQNSRLSRIECSSCSRSKSDLTSMRNAFESLHPLAKEDDDHPKTRIIPALGKTSRTDSGMWSAPVSQHTITCMRPSDQLRCMLINAKILSFAQVQRLISVPIDDNSLLKLLQQNASLVQGNWVVKSHLLFPRQSAKDTKLWAGGSNERLALIFDFLNLCFVRHRSIKRCDVQLMIKVGHEELLEMLRLLAEFDSIGKRWTFLCPKDEEFIANHPDVVRCQEEMWTIRRTQLEEQLSLKTCLKEETKLGRTCVDHHHLHHLHHHHNKKILTKVVTSGMRLNDQPSKPDLKPMKSNLDTKKNLIEIKKPKVVVKRKKSLIKVKRSSINSKRTPLSTGFKTKVKQLLN